MQREFREDIRIYVKIIGSAQYIDTKPAHDITFPLVIFAAIVLLAVLAALQGVENVVSPL